MGVASPWAGQGGVAGGGGPGSTSLPLASPSQLPSHSYHVLGFVPHVVGTASGSQTGNSLYPL